MAKLFIYRKDPLGLVGFDSETIINISVTAPGNEINRGPSYNLPDGVVELNLAYSFAGEYDVHITVDGIAIFGSPYRVFVRGVNPFCIL